MFDAHRLLLFLAAALLLAVTPGPGIFNVLARRLAGGKREGILSALGTVVGGLFHVFAAALGLSAILAASAVAFHTEVLNPKTALFFLSFIPQFVAPAHGHVFFRFALLGAISVSLNTAADLVVVGVASHLESKLKNSIRFRRRQRAVSGLGMIGLGAYLALADPN